MATYTKNDPILHNEERPDKASYLRKETKDSDNCTSAVGETVCGWGEPGNRG